MTPLPYFSIGNRAFAKGGELRGRPVLDYSFQRPRWYEKKKKTHNIMKIVDGRGLRLAVAPPHSLFFFCS